MHNILILQLFSFFCCTFLPSALAGTCIKGHRCMAGAEIYHVHRTREGGTKQNGWLLGGKFLYDHIKRYKFYWAAEASYAAGPLSGHTGQNKSIRSWFSESIVEGRVGYTFQMKSGCRAAFTPFVGGGYFWETNRFDKKSPLPIHTRTFYSYLTGGGLATINWSDEWQFGVMVKLRYMQDPRCKITKDPKFEKVSLKIGNDNLQYRIELPINYFSGCEYGLPGYFYGLTFTPFYEHFCYDRQAAFPFDYLKTSYFNYGATAAVFYYF